MAVARITTPKPLGISKTVRDFGSLTREPDGVRGRPRNVLPASIPRPLEEPRLEPAAEHGGDVALEALVREWLLELKVMGRSPRTIDWYAQKMRSYLGASNATRLSQLTAFELKRFPGPGRVPGLVGPGRAPKRPASGRRAVKRSTAREMSTSPLETVSVPAARASSSCHPVSASSISGGPSTTSILTITTSMWDRSALPWSAGGTCSRTASSGRASSAELFAGPAESGPGPHVMRRLEQRRFLRRHRIRSAVHLRPVLQRPLRVHSERLDTLHRVEPAARHLYRTADRCRRRRLDAGRRPPLRLQCHHGYPDRECERQRPGQPLPVTRNGRGPDLRAGRLEPAGLQPGSGLHHRRLDRQQHGAKDGGRMPHVPKDAVAELARGLISR